MSLTLRRDLLGRATPELRRRRAIALLGIVGASAMAPPALLQMGIVRHLPDPPGKRWDSDKVNTSEEAYALGVPDAALVLASLAAHVPLAGIGRRGKWLPRFVAAKAAIEAAGAAAYLWKMLTKEKAWCPWCFLGGAASAAIFLVSLPEALGTTAANAGAPPSPKKSSTPPRPRHARAPARRVAGGRETERRDGTEGA